ncbi:MAG TPA: hypothetical protein DEQ74_00015 [Wolbachia sp.]|nr:hypothetical protein [Wolbachia sp.]
MRSTTSKSLAKPGSSFVVNKIAISCKRGLMNFNAAHGFYKKTSRFFVTQSLLLLHRVYYFNLA